MSIQSVGHHVLNYFRDEKAGVSLEYALLVMSMLILLLPSLSHYVGGIGRLFGFVGSLIR
jgi:Flp pilus assembly pilin Flp